MKTNFLTFLLIFALSTSQVISQQTTPSSQDDIVKITTTIVQMDAIVTDKAGKRITGLSAEDFQIYDENTLQPVDYFTAIENSKVTRSDKPAKTAGNTSNPESATNPLTTPYIGRHIAILFDDVSLASENSVRARQALSDYIDGKLTTNDMAAIISMGGIGGHQQFTNDKQRLKSALKRIVAVNNNNRNRGNNFNITPAEAVRIEANDDQVLKAVTRRVATDGSLANQTAAGSVFQSNNGVQEADQKSLEAKIRAEARQVLSQSEYDTRKVLAQLNGIFKAMADLPGRKIVVLLTETLTTLGQSSGDIPNQISLSIELARRSGVSVYALDAAGLKTKSVKATESISGVGLYNLGASPDAMFSDYENLSAARQIVTGTGGQLIANTNDIVGGLNRAVEDASSYYVIGFTPKTLDNAFHKLQIKIKDKPDLVVRTRRGYLAVNQQTVQGTNAELLAGLMSPLPRIDLPIELVAYSWPRTGEQIITVGLHVGKNYLSLPKLSDTVTKADYEVVLYGYAVGKDEPVLGFKRVESQDIQKLSKDGLIIIPQPFTNLPPGNYQIRAVVREKTSGAVGSGYQFFEIPDTKNRKIISLSSLLLNDAGETTFNGEFSFKAGSEIDMRYIIYNLPKDIKNLSQAVSLIDSNGSTLMHSELAINTTPVSVDSSQAIQQTRLLVPKVRGRYALIVTMKDAKGVLDVERRTDFVVE